jgi:hypothetical protein
MNDPAIESVAAEVYTVPTDAPEGDGTLTWDATTLVLARVVQADGVEGLGWTYGAPACESVMPMRTIRGPLPDWGLGATGQEDPAHQIHLPQSPSPAPAPDCR